MTKSIKTLSVIGLWLVLVASLYAEQLSKYVVLVIIDGARYSETLGDSAGQYIPKMKAISDVGVVVDSMINDGITYTNRAIPAIWTGSWVPPRDTTVTVAGFGTLNTQYSLVPSIWEYYRKTYTADASQAIYVIKYLSTPWLQSYCSDYGPNYWPSYIVQGSTDSAVWESAKSQLMTYHPRLSVIYLADVDHFGHSGVWENYTTAIMIADSIVGVIWDFLQNDRYFKDNTTLFVTNDHGRHLDGVSTGFKGHGDDCWGCRHIMLLGSGPALKSGGIHVKTLYKLTDITPTIGAILDFETPYAVGRPMTDILQIPEGITSSSSPHNFSIAVTNYPNPFNASTRIAYRLFQADFVSLAIYDLGGRLVETLVNGKQTAGDQFIVWDGQNQAAGIYFYRLITGGVSTIGKCLLVK